MDKHIVSLYEALIEARDGDYMTADRVYNEALSKHYRDHLGELYDTFYANVQLQVSIGPGWIPLYIAAVKDIKEVMDANPGFRCKPMQVKEKFGDLRMYIRCWTEGEHGGEDGGDLTIASKHDHAAKLILKITCEAENISNQVCEICGEPGTKVSPSGWIRVACEKHAK